MKQNIHLISGLPRAGSTLLSAIFRQNPRFHAGISGPLAGLVANQVRVMSMHEAAMFISNQQRKRILQSLIEAFYSELEDKAAIFDSNRAWCSLLPTVTELLPGTRIVCCVRSPAWIVDSIERLVQKNGLLCSKMFGTDRKADDMGNVYTRFESLMKTGMVGYALKGLRQAWFGEHARRMVVVRYDSLVARPAQVMDSLYRFIGLEPFEHRFDNVEYEESEFDSRLNMPGLHRVSGKVEVRQRETILPPELFKQNHVEFWNLEGQNPRGVTVL